MTSTVTYFAQKNLVAKLLVKCKNSLGGLA